MRPDSFLILLVDDEPPVIDILKRVGAQVFPEATIRSHSSPQAVLDYLSDQTTQKPHLVLLDIDLHSQTDGIELLPRLRLLLDRKVPIIMFSDSVDPAQVEESYRFGAVAYTRKPATWEAWKTYVSMLKTYWYKTALVPGKHLL